MPGGKETTETQVQFSPQREQLLGQVFGSTGFTGATQGGLLDFLFGRGQGQQGTGLAGIDQIFGGFQPALNISPLQRQATNQLGQFLNQPSPEQRTFQLGAFGLAPIVAGQGQFGNVAEALTPIFERNLQSGIANLSAAVPGGSRFGSAFAQQGTDLSQRALQDFNLFVEQARQQDVQNRIGGALALGQLAQSAGGAPFQRLLQAGQFGLGESQFLSQPGLIGQQNQLQAQLALLQMLNQPTGQTATTSGGGGFGDLLGGLVGFGAGALGGPFLGALGAGLGNNLFGGGGGGGSPITRQSGRTGFRIG